MEFLDFKKNLKLTTLNLSFFKRDTSEEDKETLRIFLAKPETHNAFSDVMIEELSQVFEFLSESSVTVKTVILEGLGPSFCAGADLRWMKSFKEASFEETLEDSKKLRRLFDLAWKCPCFVIAVIHGVCMGGGVGLASISDFVLAQEKSRWGLTEVTLGLSPAVISPFVLRKIPFGKAAPYFLTGKKFSASVACDLNLAHQLFVEEEEKKKMLEEILLSLQEVGPLALRETKKLLRFFDENPSSVEISSYTCNLIAHLRRSEEGQEGMLALLEKRRALWKK